MKIKLIFIFILLSFSTSLLATTIRVVEFQNIIEKNKNLIILYNKIQEDQKVHAEAFENQELELKKKLDEIEQLKLILDNNELQIEIENYNSNLRNFNLKIEKFNLHYDNQVNDLKNKIINIILNELKIYSTDNQIDLIMDSNNYILSSNSINITNLILDKTNEIEIEINFENYK